MSSGEASPDAPIDRAVAEKIMALANEMTEWMARLPDTEKETFAEGTSEGTCVINDWERSLPSHIRTPEGGNQNFSFQTTHERSTSILHRAIRLVRGATRPRTGYFFRAESFFNVASEIERLDREPSFGPPIADSYGGRSLHMQSHGESFFALFMNRFGADGLYVLDEPDAALSLSRQFALLRRLHELVQESRCQFIIATHSPVLLAYPDATIFELSEAGIRHVAYAESEIYVTARDFFRDPARMVDRLLRDDEES